jgi:uncharacterized protein (TIGR03435 family)
VLEGFGFTNMRIRAKTLLLAGTFLCLAAVNAYPQGRPAGPPAFEVASIKLSDPNKPVEPPQILHGSFRATDRVFGLIMLAFNLNRQWVEGGPDWIERDRYEIAAKGDTSAGPDEIKLMLQSLLSQRFQLKYHREGKTLAGYALTVDPKKGMLAKISAEGTPRDGRGAIQVDTNGMEARGVSMKLLCRFLSSIALSGPVVDNTGLDGIYDYKLLYDDPNVSAASAEPAQYGSIFAALQTIGLRLTSAKVPISVLHIDSIERPSGN